MIMNKFKKTLKNALTFNFILMTALPILVISFFTLQLLSDNISKQIIEKNHIIAESIAAETDNFLLTADKVIQQAADGVQKIGLENSELSQQYLVSIIENFPYFTSIQIVDEEGVVRMIAPYNLDYVGNNISGKSYYKNTVETNQPFWSTTFMSSMTGQPTITLIRPIKQGMIVADLNLGSLNQIVMHGNKLSDGWAGIIDTQGTYIGHTITKEVEQRTNVIHFDFIKKALGGDKGNYEKEYNDHKYLMSVTVVDRIGWPIVVAQNADTALAPVKIARNIFIISAVISLFVALLLSMLLLNKIIKPITALVKNMKLISVGKYQVVMEKEEYEELADLSNSFFIMAEAVASREKALENSKKELEASLKKLEISNQELDQFAYITSHDLKAPLRAIMNLAEWLEEDLAECIDESAREKLNLMRSRAQRMENLIIGILEYSRIGRVKNKLEVVDTRELIDEISKQLEYPPEFMIEIAPFMPKVSAYRIQLWQVFSNLIGNAVKHHHQNKGIISITAVEHEDFYEFSVADNGPGIDKEQHEKVFQIFQTLKPRDQFESTGVGLALVKKIIKQQGGDIRIKSELGQGATFIFTWPKQINE